MPLAAALKTLSEISLYFTAAGFVLGYFGLSSVMLPVPFILALAVGAYCLLQRRFKLLRFLPLLLIPACFFFAKNLTDAVCLIPPCAYALIVSLLGRFKFDRWQAVSLLKKGLVASIAIIIISIVFADSFQTRLAVTWTCVFCIASALLCRMLRLDENVWDSPRFILSNLIPVAGAGALAALLSSDLILGSVGSAGSAFYRKLILPVITWIMHLLSYAVKGAGSLLGEIELNEPELDEFGKNMSARDLDLEIEGELGRGSDILFKILAVIGILLFLFIAFLVFYHFLRDNSRAAEKKDAPAWEKASGGEGKAKRHIFQPHDERWHVRETYRKFLALCRKRGMEITQQQTSGDISREAEKFFDPADLEELRSVYAPARYSPEPVKKDSSKRAKDAYSRMKSTK